MGNHGWTNNAKKMEKIRSADQTLQTHRKKLKRKRLKLKMSSKLKNEKPESMDTYFPIIAPLQTTCNMKGIGGGRTFQNSIIVSNQPI